MSPSDSLLQYRPRQVDKACATSIGGGRLSYFLMGFLTNSNFILTHLGKQDTIHIQYKGFSASSHVYICSISNTIETALPFHLFKKEWNSIRNSNLFSKEVPLFLERVKAKSCFDKCSKWNKCAPQVNSRNLCTKYELYPVYLNTSK